MGRRLRLKTNEVHSGVIPDEDGARHESLALRKHVISPMKALNTAPYIPEFFPLEFTALIDTTGLEPNKHCQDFS